MKGGGGNFRFVSFRLDLAREPMSGNLLVLTGPGETADFEFTPGALGDLRLEVKTQLPGWIIPIVVRVR
jgi:hypothetical protein